jgi:chromosomal replication initiator protein
LSSIASDQLSCIALERPASVRKHLPKLAENWMVDHYWVGPENDGLKFLFDECRIGELASVAPIVFYGEQSLGKTALAITLAVRWSRITHQRPLVITTAESFCSEYAAAVEIDDVDSFRQKYRRCKMLVVDGLDSLSGKLAAQDELAATLDSLQESNRPCLFTGSVLPATLKGFKANLSSRLCCGYTLRLCRPGKAARRALMESLVAKLDPLLPLEKLLSLIDNLPSCELSPVELYNVVKVAQQNRTASCELDLDTVATLVKQQLLGFAPSLPNITKSVCRRLQVKLLDVRGSTREASIVRARSISIYLARKLTTLSLCQIGEYYSGRDHSTILHSIQKIGSLLESDVQLANLCREIEAEMLCEANPS